MNRSLPSKTRLDLLLVERNLAPSREKARAYILAGLVLVNGKKIDKAGTTVAGDVEIELVHMPDRYVSRGGYKLEAAIQEFALDFSGRKVMDIGASTGGFTDCALQHGAECVWAVDVGYGQLAWKIRSDPRVTVLEKTNIRLLPVEDIPLRFDIVTIDVSFISLKLVFPVAARLLEANGLIVSLVKPQFEAGRERVGKKGVVRDPETHFTVLKACRDYAAQSGLNVLSAGYSPIKGPEGNIEFLFCLEAAASGRSGLEDKDLLSLVEQAHNALGAV